MRAETINGAGAEALSLLGWWQLAGVDVLVDEAPRDWLQAPARPAIAEAAAAPALDAQPASIAAMHHWLATAAMPGESAPRLAPAGDPAAPLMILVDMPEPQDSAEGRLVDGDAGRLLDRMLAAIGLARDAIYLSPLAPARPAAGRIDAANETALAAAARAHVAIAKPKYLLLLGDAPTRALLGTGFAQARGRLHGINQEATRIIASFPPRLLLRQPALKAEAWKDLRMLAEELSK